MTYIRSVCLYWCFSAFQRFMICYAKVLVYNCANTRGYKNSVRIYREKNFCFAWLISVWWLHYIVRMMFWFFYQKCGPYQSSKTCCCEKPVPREKSQQRPLYLVFKACCRASWNTFKHVCSRACWYCIVSIVQSQQDQQCQHCTVSAVSAMSALYSVSIVQSVSSVSNVSRISSVVSVSTGSSGLFLLLGVHTALLK